MKQHNKTALMVSGMSIFIFILFLLSPKVPAQPFLAIMLGMSIILWNKQRSKNVIRGDSR